MTASRERQLEQQQRRALTPEKRRDAGKQLDDLRAARRRQTDGA